MRKPCLGKIKYWKPQAFLLGGFKFSHIAPFLNSLLFLTAYKAARRLTSGWADPFLPQKAFWRTVCWYK